MNRRNFIVLAEMRTGGNMLADSLDHHSHLSVLGEIFSNQPSPFHETQRQKLWAHLFPGPASIDWNMNFVPLLQEVFDQHDGLLLHRQWQISQDNPTWTYLAGRTELKVIHLHRENVFQQYLSEQLALASGVWWLEPGTQRPAWKPLAIDVDQCLATMRERRAAYAWSRALFRAHPQIIVRYEDIAADVRRVLTYCQGFLEVPHEELPVNHRKLTNKRPSELVTNLDEVRCRLRGTEFAQLSLE